MNTINTNLSVKIGNPKISIGIPIYNGEKFLTSTIESILKQTFVDFEIIISNNASTDKTSDICKKFTSIDSRIKYFNQSKNIGMLNNYSFVLEKAKGKYFMWIAADDLLSGKDYLSKMLKKFNDNIDYAFPEVNIIDDKDNVIHAKLMLPFHNAKTRFDFALASIKNNSQIFYGLFKTSIIRDDYYLLEMFKNLDCYGEGYFVHVISVERKGVCVQDACKLYRRHTNMQSTSVPAYLRVYYFVKYAVASLNYFYQNKYFSRYQKFEIIIRMLVRILPYFIRLMISMIAQKFPKINKLRRKFFIK